MFARIDGLRARFDRPLHGSRKWNSLSSSPTRPSSNNPTRSNTSRRYVGEGHRVDLLLPVAIAEERPPDTERRRHRVPRSLFPIVPFGPRSRLRGPTASAPVRSERFRPRRRTKSGATSPWASTQADDVARSPIRMAFVQASRGDSGRSLSMTRVGEAGAPAAKAPAATARVKISSNRRQTRPTSKAVRRVVLCFERREAPREELALVACGDDHR